MNTQSGYASFKKVAEGMPTARRVLAAPTCPGGCSVITKGKTMIKPVSIIAARRIG